MIKNNFFYLSVLIKNENKIFNFRNSSNDKRIKKTSSSIKEISSKLMKETLEDKEEESDSFNEGSDQEDWSDIENQNGNIKNSKTHMNPQVQSFKAMNYQSIDKLFQKFSGKINIYEYEFSSLDGTDRYLICNAMQMSNSERRNDMFSYNNYNSYSIYTRFRITK